MLHDPDTRRLLAYALLAFGIVLLIVVPFMIRRAKAAKAKRLP